MKHQRHSITTSRPETPRRDHGLLESVADTSSQAGIAAGAYNKAGTCSGRNGRDNR
jgi:hypothetical protein